MSERVDTAPSAGQMAMTLLRRGTGAAASGWGRALISLALLVPLGIQVDLGTTLTIAGTAAPILLVAAVATAAAQYVLSAYRWFILVCSHHRVAFGLILKVTFVSSFLGWFLPGGGIEAVRLYGLSRAAPEVGWAVASVVVERVIGLLALAMLALAGLLLSSAALPPALAMATAGALALLLCSLPLAMAPPVRRAALTLLSVLRPVAPARWLERFYREVDAMCQAPGLLLWTVLLTLVCQAARIAIAVLCAQSIGLAVPVVHFVALMPAVIFVSLLPISIGGLGVREVTFVQLFALVGLPAETALATATLTLAANVIASLPGLWWYAVRR